MYAGWPKLSLLPSSRRDPLFGGLDSGLPVLKWHEDMIEVPDEFSVELIRAVRAAGGEPLVEVGHNRVSRELLRGTNAKHGSPSITKTDCWSEGEPEESAGISLKCRLIVY